jgi:hypothetical protein
MKYTFLHISDLHYKNNWHEEISIVCRHFLADVVDQVNKYDNCYLIFSGDFVIKASHSELYTSFESEIANALDRAGFSPDHRICVPGNHDISQDVLKPLLSMQKGVLSEMRDERIFNDSFPHFFATYARPKFESYAAFESRFANYNSSASESGGCGWTLPGGVGVYCLNTAICSFAGLEDSSGRPISDKDQLMIDTRSLYRWLGEAEMATRILVMHHPIDWLHQWTKNELEKIVASDFRIVFSGHLHEGITTYCSHGNRGTVVLSAPPLFTRKSELLGYSFVTLDSEEGKVDVHYRQWTPQHKFVNGTSLAGNDSGTVEFSMNKRSDVPVEILSRSSTLKDTEAILEEEFEEATTFYSSKKQIWIDRDLANMPETIRNDDNAVLSTQNDLIANLRSCVIRSPKQFGLTSLGRYIALEYFRRIKDGNIIAMLDTEKVPDHRRGVIQHVHARCEELRSTPSLLAGFILDNWQPDKRSHRVLRELTREFPGLPVIVLHGIEDCAQISEAIVEENALQFENIYLWALTRPRIREIVIAYIEGIAGLDEDLLTKKITEDLSALNIHRTPSNCLLILKLAEQAFDDSPVNRTEMIGRVLYLLFYQFDKIPRYATRPDLKDCEYALGYFSEWLIHSGKTGFSKAEFFEKVSEYCKAHLIDLEIEVLFAFLATEHIFVRKGYDFEFRFNYWLYFFAAHRMHHSKDFAEFILNDRRYSAFPEILEFYAGIDRRRSDAVVRLTEDLNTMSIDFLDRTGINEGFNPFSHARWAPSEEAINAIRQEIANSAKESALPAVIKDRIADKTYDRSKPYNQELARFLQESSLMQLMQATRGAARALRNSDHVEPELKTKLLEAVVCCLTRVSQILALISPILAEKRTAIFEDICFILTKSFDDVSGMELWERIMSAIPDNIVWWFQEDIFSKKMGPLLIDYVRKHGKEIGQLFVLLLMVRQRSPNWEKEVERFIVSENKNSFRLAMVASAMWNEFKYSFSSERNRQELRRLYAMSVAKHDVGVKHPNITLTEKVAKTIDQLEAQKEIANPG